tara:strand:+ start:2006 stop:4117 length:2112 start_codon:yes stop_codon:yes gene_type:complete
MLTLVVLSVLVVFSISEVSAEEKISVSAKSFDNTIIIEFENEEKNTSNIKTVKIWLSADNSFKSFKSDLGWGGGEYSDGQLLVFTASNPLKPGESVKFGVITDKKASGINWKVLDENDISLGSNTVSSQEISESSAVVEEGIDDGTVPSGEKLYGTKMFVPEKIRIDSNTRLIGNGFGPEQTLKLYLNDDLLKSVKTDLNGNFITTIAIDATVMAGTNEFIIMDESGNTQITNINIDAAKNRFKKTVSDFEITNITTEVKLDETLTISGKAEPKSSIIMTLSNADGDKEKIRVVSVDVNGEWIFEEIVSRDSSLGTKSILMKNQQNYVQRDILVKSDKSIIISLPATRYNPGDVITLSGTGLPNKDVTIIIKDTEDKIIHYEILNGKNSGNISFEYTTEKLAPTGTYTLIANQEGETDVNLFGIGQYPTSQIVVLMDKKSYISSSTVQMNIIGPPSTGLMLVVIDPSDNNKFSDTIITNSQGKIKYLLDVSNYASGVYQIVVTKGNVQDSTQFSIGLQTASGPITLNTSKQVYVPGDRIILLGQTGNESLITITLFDPSGNIFGKSEVFSSFDGNFSSEELGLPTNAELGTWKITAHSKLNSATHEITVSETSQLILSLLIEKTEFNVGETMMIKGVGPTTSSHIDIEIIGGGETIVTLGTPITGTGEFSVPWIIPGNLTVGAYIINIDNGQVTANFQFYITE